VHAALAAVSAIENKRPNVYDVYDERTFTRFSYGVSLGFWGGIQGKTPDQKNCIL